MVFMGQSAAAWSRRLRGYAWGLSILVGCGQSPEPGAACVEGGAAVPSAAASAPSATGPRAEPVPSPPPPAQHEPVARSVGPEGARSRVLNWAASTLLVSNFVHETKAKGEPTGTFVLRDIECLLTTPEYYYAIGGCEAVYQARSVELSDQTAALLFALANGGDGAGGKLVFGFSRLECEGASRDAKCVLWD